MATSKTTPTPESNEAPSTDTTDEATEQLRSVLNEEHWLDFTTGVMDKLADKIGVKYLRDLAGHQEEAAQTVAAELRKWFDIAGADYVDVAEGLVNLVINAR